MCKLKMRLLFFYIFLIFSFGFLNLCNPSSRHSHSSRQNFPEIKDFTADTNLRELFFLYFKAAKPSGKVCLKTVEAIKKFQPINEIGILCQKNMQAYFQNEKDPEFLNNIVKKFESLEKQSPLYKDFLSVCYQYQWGGAT